MIQPSFSFLVGVGLPYSVARRQARDARSAAVRPCIVRSVLLIALGIFLRSMQSRQTNFTFEDTLTQIGLGYPFLFLLAFRSVRTQWTALWVDPHWVTCSPGAYPVPGSWIRLSGRQVPADWTHHYSGLAAHWNKNSNLGQAFDVWFLNRLPRESPFVANGGGYLTLSFIPTLGTMILGLIAGGWLRASAPAIPLKRLIVAGVAGLVVGALLHVTGICPVVKRIWTPSWTLFSGGWCFLFLAAFCWVIETRGYRSGRSAGGNRPQLHRGISDRAPVRGLHRHFVPDPPGAGRLRHVRRRARALHPRRGGARRLLADLVLDVPEEDLLADLTGGQEVKRSPVKALG
jgi:predicted acyltransferase